jgi:hypothetical protein
VEEEEEEGEEGEEQEVEDGVSELHRWGDERAPRTPLLREGPDEIRHHAATVAVAATTAAAMSWAQQLRACPCLPCTGLLGAVSGVCDVQL